MRGPVQADKPRIRPHGQTSVSRESHPCAPRESIVEHGVVPWRRRRRATALLARMNPDLRTQGGLTFLRCVRLWIKLPAHPIDSAMTVAHAIFEHGAPDMRQHAGAPVRKRHDSFANVRHSHCALIHVISYPNLLYCSSARNFRKAWPSIGLEISGIDREHPNRVMHHARIPGIRVMRRVTLPGGAPPFAPPRSRLGRAASAPPRAWRHRWSGAA